MPAFQTWWGLSFMVVSALALTEHFAALPAALAALGAAGYMMAVGRDRG